MFQLSIRSALTGAVAAVVISLASCASVPSVGLPAGLSNALGQVTNYSAAVANWNSSLSSVIDDAGLGRLKEFAVRAGSLGATAGSFKGEVADAAADPLGVIATELTGMGALDVEGLRGLGEAQKRAVVDTFADSAARVGTLVDDFLGRFGG